VLPVSAMTLVDVLVGHYPGELPLYLVFSHGSERAGDHEERDDTANDDD